MTIAIERIGCCKWMAVGRDPLDGARVFLSLCIDPRGGAIIHVSTNSAGAKYTVAENETMECQVRFAANQWFAMRGEYADARLENRPAAQIAQYRLLT